MVKIGSQRKVAYFITSHGFGHAARACAVMLAIRDLDPSITFELLTNTPRWFFDESLDGGFNLHPLQTDVGLIQKSPMMEDIPATLKVLKNFFPIATDLKNELCKQIQDIDANLIISDISALGLEIAAASGLPSVLIENFTWDWIYEAYAQDYPEISTYAEYLGNIYKKASLRIQVEPICQYAPSTVKIQNPVSRKPRFSRSQVRKQLNIPMDARVVLVSFGGIPIEHQKLNHLFDSKDYFFILPGGGDCFTVRDNLILLPHHSNFYHPDLVHASDVVVGKTGYSTVAEAFHAGASFGFLSRSNFRESSILAEFTRTRLHGIEIPEDEFNSGSWLRILPDLMKHSTVREKPVSINGADEVAKIILTGNYLP